MTTLLLKTLPWKQLRPWSGTREDGRLWVQNRAVSGPAGDTPAVHLHGCHEAWEVDDVISRSWWQGTEPQESPESEMRKRRREGAGCGGRQMCVSRPHLSCFVFQLSNCFYFLFF